ncbi:MAG: DegV family protein [Bacilli bacterium]
MNNYRLIVDSSCDLPQDYYEKHNIGVTDLIINFGERSYRDRKDITSSEIIKIAKETNIIPKTSALNIADLTDVFAENLKKFDHIFYMPISSAISSCLNNARLAAQQFDGRVTCLDSLSLSSGCALAAMGIIRDMNTD